MEAERGAVWYALEEHIRIMTPILNKQQRRIFLGSIANDLGHGGVKLVCELSGVSRITVAKGRREIAANIKILPPPERRKRRRKTNN